MYENNRPYIAFWRGKRHELFAKTSFDAQEAAAKHFKAKKSYEVSVLLADVENVLT
jgi:hypothetical protein